MKEVIAQGKSLDEIRSEWAGKWQCRPDDIELEIKEKPGFFNKNWTVRIILNEEAAAMSSKTELSWDGEKYTITPGKAVETIVPFIPAGRLVHDNSEIFEEYSVRQGNSFEFYPLVKEGGLQWNIKVLDDGEKAVAVVKHDQAGKYVFVEDIPGLPRLCLERYLRWETSSETGEVWDEEKFKQELTDNGIVNGIIEDVWSSILTVEGTQQIIIAEGTPAVPTIQPTVDDNLEESANQIKDYEKIDYFASKLKICHEGEILARKIPGKEGTPGMDVLGNLKPVEKLADFQLKVKQNVHLSEDGLEVIASCTGSPRKLEKYTYSVENVYVIKDVDLSIGSIDFPGNVFINGNVHEGFHVCSGGALSLQGSASNAVLKAETGLLVKNNIIASKIIVGEKHVYRSQFIKLLQEISEDLHDCITQAEQLENSLTGKNVPIGQMLKVIIEKNFRELPKKAEEAEKLLANKDEQLIDQELDIAIRSIKHFIVGAGPLQIKSLTFLKSSMKVVASFLEMKKEIFVESIVCDVNYIQNSDLKCAGDFICRKGVYNSTINAEGKVTISGVCRGGEIVCGQDVYIKELGGSNISATVIKVNKQSKINVDFCHSNVIFHSGKEIARIDEPVQRLNIYRENGLLRVEKIKWDK